MVPQFPSITRLFGIELEFFLTDREGSIANKADDIIRSLKPRLQDSSITKESGKSMIELVTFPSRSSREVFGTFFKDFESLLFEAEVNDLGLYYYGTYPGKNTTQKRTDIRYAGKEKVLGKSWPIAQRCIGFHYHYTLPRYTFNQNIKFFYPDIKEQRKTKVLNLYNLYVALDPALIALMQSSPYYEGRYLGKDSRVMVYRGDEAFKNEQLYGEHGEFGCLNDYAGDFESLVEEIRGRAKQWGEMLRQHKLTYSDFAKKDSELSLLDSSWKPVKISSHGTIESRGADMNCLSKVVAKSAILKSLSKFVQRSSLHVQPGPLGNEEPFKLEDEVLHVPEHDELVRLQVRAAVKGLEDKQVLAYSRALLSLAKEIVPIENSMVFRPFAKSLSEKHTTSDDILRFVKHKQGYTDTIEEGTARELALKSGQDIYKDLLITKKMNESLLP